jgi:ABC-type dipeptide/oligopeptide/nickel transport system ATPase component
MDYFVVSKLIHFLTLELEQSFRRHDNQEGHKKALTDRVPTFCKESQSCDFSRRCIHVSSDQFQRPYSLDHLLTYYTSHTSYYVLSSVTTGSSSN